MCSLDGVVGSLSRFVRRQGMMSRSDCLFFFFQAEDGIRDYKVTGVQTCALPISPGDLMTRLYIFADDSMRGREAGTPGNVKGTDYIAAEIKRAGLVPAGEDGTYFQTLPLQNPTVDTTAPLTPAGARLTALTDHPPLPAPP